MSVFSYRLSEQGKRRHWSKTYLAQLLGISLSRYANWEYDLAQPDIATMRKLVILFHTSADYLIGVTNNPKPVHAEIVKPLTKEQANRCADIISKSINKALKEMTKNATY